jgi:hypothetical protein
MLSRSFRLKDYISLRAPRQIFFDPPARLRQPICHSHRDNIPACLIYPTCNASSLSLIFTSFRPLNIIMSQSHSKFVITLDEFDRWKSEKGEMWISRFFRWKWKLCFLWIICNSMLFVFKIKYFLNLLYPRITHLGKQPVRSALIGPRADSRPGRARDPDYVRFYRSLHALFSIGVPWLSEFPAVLTQLMPSLPIIIFYRFRFGQISASRKRPGATGGSLNRSSRAHPNFITMRMRCPGPIINLFASFRLLLGSTPLDSECPVSVGLR